MLLQLIYDHAYKTLKTTPTKTYKEIKYNFILLKSHLPPMIEFYLYSAEFFYIATFVK